MVLFQTFDCLLGLLQSRNSFLKCNSSGCCEFLGFFFFYISLKLLLVSFSLFLFCIGRLALHFFNEFISLSSLFFHFNHLNLKLFLETQDLGFSFIENLQTQSISLDLSFYKTFLLIKQTLIE